MKKVYLILLVLIASSLTACQDNSIDNTIGFKEKDGKKMYMKEAGIYAKDEVLNIEGDDYYFDANSIMTTDTWHDDMYFNEWGKAMTYGKTPDARFVKNKKMVKDAIVDEGDKYYYFNTNGDMVKDDWVDKSSKYYYFKDDGVMARNELLDIDNSMYYFGDKGNMAVNSWVNKMTMYSGNDGAILKNTHTPDGFYVGDDGVKMEDPEIAKRKKENEKNAEIISKVVVDNIKQKDKIKIEDEELLQSKFKDFLLNSNINIDDSIYLGDTLANVSMKSNHSVDDILDMAEEIYDVCNKVKMPIDNTVGFANDLLEAGMSLAEGDVISSLITVLNNDIITNSDNVAAWGNALGFDTSNLKETWDENTPQVLSIMLKLLSGNPVLIGDVLLDVLKMCGLEDALKTEFRAKLAYAAEHLPLLIAEAKAAWDESIAYNKAHPEEFYEMIERMSNMAEGFFTGIANKFSEYLKTKKPIELNLNKNEITNSATNITIIDNETNETLTTASNYSNIQVGDTITFGSYEQDANGLNGQEPIEWNVLDINGDKALLHSKYILDCKEYNNVSTSTSDTSWESCTLRGWLNNNFYNKAFTNDEKQIINQNSVSNNAYRIPNIGTEGYEGRGNTNDYVFILDYNEVQTYLSTDKKAKKTPYSFTQNIDAFNGDYGYWELRMPYVKKFDNDYVNADGEQSSGMAVVSYTGNYDEYADVDRKVGIRPAIWIKYE